jgi:acetyl-CoA acetyltransferase
MTDQRVAIVAGVRTPFVKAGQAFATLGPLALAKHTVRGLLEHSASIRRGARDRHPGRSGSAWHSRKGRGGRF